MRLTTPAGYVRLAGQDGAGARVTDGACRSDCADAVGEALGTGVTLHAWAAHQPDRRVLRGRDVAYAVTLPNDAATVVVRHSRHGGLLAPVTRDLFLPPTRAPYELETSRALRARGVRTPDVVAWIAYRAGPLLRRADVVTRLVPNGRDLAAALADPSRDASPHASWRRATVALLGALARAGARHPDLNLKNVLLAPSAGGPADDAMDAWVLDVDVVALSANLPNDAQAAAVAATNWARLERSLEKWRQRHALPLGDDELATLRREALAAASVAPPRLVAASVR